MVVREGVCLLVGRVFLLLAHDVPGIVEQHLKSDRTLVGLLGDAMIFGKKRCFYSFSLTASQFLV